MAAFRKPAAAGTALLALAGGSLLVSGCGGKSTPSPTPAPTPARSTPLVSIFEAQHQLVADPAATLTELRGLGVGVVRVFVPWAALAPRPLSRTAPRGFDAASPAAYPASRWAPYDAIVRAARPRGIAVYFSLEGPAPLWAAGREAPPNSPGNGGFWKPSPVPYGAFVHAVGTRYSGHYVPAGGAPLPRVSIWSLWNEPNDGPELAPQATHDSTVEASAAVYRRLLDQGWKALETSGHGGDEILIGELAPYGQSIGRNVPGDYGEMVPLRFVRALYCVNSSLQPLRGTAATLRGCPATAAGSQQFAKLHPALFQATGMAVHPYPGTGQLPPSLVLSTSPDFANLAALPKLARLLDSVAATYGSSRQLPLYSTEYGYFTNPPFPAGAPPALAAAYLNWAEYITWRDPRIRSFDQYLLTDPSATSPSKFVTGLEYANGRRKPSYAAWRMPIYLPLSRAKSGAALEVWGCVRPAPHARTATGHLQQARIELRVAGRWQTEQTISVPPSSCYFDTRVRFTSGGVVRLAWSYPHGSTIYSRGVPITLTS
jgi:hypothetical protein